MHILSTTSDVIRFITSSANALDVTTAWVDNQTATATPYTPGRTNTAIAAATTTTVLPAPAASTQRQLKKLTACAKGGAQTITVQFFDGTTAFQLFLISLSTSETLEYEDLAGWMVRDSTGALKTTGLGSGRLIRKPQVLTGGTTYNPPAGCNAILVECIGGGGGGGGTVLAGAGLCAMGGGGGGGGGYARRYYAGPPQGCTIAIGAAGVAGANTGAVAGNGGITTFTDGTTLITANGGAGSPAQIAAGAAAAVTLGGAGAAVSTNGDVNWAGCEGENGIRFAAGAANQGLGAGGGNGPMGGGGGLSRVTSGAGNNAVANTGGGGGAALALTGAAAAVGGTGSAGVIIISEYT